MTDHFLKKYGSLAPLLEELEIRTGHHEWDPVIHGLVWEGEYEALEIPCHIITVEVPRGHGHKVGYPTVDNPEKILSIAPSAVVTNKLTAIGWSLGTTIAVQSDKQFEELKKEIHGLTDRSTYHRLDVKASKRLIRRSDLSLYWNLRVESDMQRAIHTATLARNSYRETLRRTNRDLKQIPTHAHRELGITQDLLDIAKEWNLHDLPNLVSPGHRPFVSQALEIFLDDTMETVNAPNHAETEYLQKLSLSMGDIEPTTSNGG